MSIEQYNSSRQLAIAVILVLLSISHVFAKPSVLGFSPEYPQVPENTLRLYVTFSDSMKYGQVRDKVYLLNSAGVHVKNSFLNLRTELWDSKQKMLTLIIDPGRIKQNVGPNMSFGAPMVAGRTYKLVIDGSMENIDGIELGTDKSTTYIVVKATRKALSVHDWEVNHPKENTAPVLIKFDRLMDTAAALRLITVVDSESQKVLGTSETDGRIWRFKPKKPWQVGEFKIVIHPELEDVSGNTLRAPFDAPSGTIGKTQKTAILNFHFDNISNK